MNRDSLAEENRANGRDGEDGPGRGPDLGRGDNSDSEYPSGHALVPGMVCCLVSLAVQSRAFLGPVEGEDWRRLARRGWRQ